MTNYRVSRNGEIKAIVPLVIHADGTLWNANGKAPLIDSQAPGFVAAGAEKITVLLKAGNFNEIPNDCFSRVGLSDTGLEVISCDDIRAAEAAALTPAQKERIRISKLYAKANSRLNAEDDCNTMDYYRIKAEADGALKEWRANYPKDAAEEKANNLDMEAERQEELASGALVFDMDGSLSADDQQKRHDDFMAKAADLRKQAETLRK